MHKTKIVVFLSFFIILSIGVQAQGFLKADGKRIINGKGEQVILRGYGLGGWMLMEGYMMQTSDFANAQYQIKNKIRELIGPADTEAFFNAWLANHVRQVDIDSLKSWGFNSVRLPMHYNLFTLPVELEPVIGTNTWLEKGFALTDSLLKWCAKNEIYLILDLHAAPGGQGKDAAISDYDPSKPSLWQSDRNKAKTVALWRKLAERYANEPWIGGYDLLNETNWDLPNGTALKNLYLEITDAIREVDKNHIIFIEGNWFANDFTGLTPPWDKNMAYSFHKYWSNNDKGSIQWVLDIRENHNVPLWMGEAGENSNTWFRDAIKLFEENKIGWAWWPMKKVESISAPLSIVKTSGYQSLLNYWKGTGPKPSAETAKTILMDLAEKAKLENCVYQKDVIDAMIRQVKSDDPKPWSVQQIPGLVYCSEFDLGANTVAYSDKDVANYHLSTNNYTAWNTGWVYRNDGVDLEPCLDFPNNKGYNVGWINDGEWMLYTVNVASEGAYDVQVRTASENSGGSFRLQLNGTDLRVPETVTKSLGWQAWKNIEVKNLVLPAGQHKLKFMADRGGFNLNYLDFTFKGSSKAVATSFVSGETQSDKTSISISLNKPLNVNVPLTPAGFILYVNGVAVPISMIQYMPGNNRKLIIRTSQSLRWTDEIKLSYVGVQVLALDGDLLTQFDKKPIKNTLPSRHTIPGKIEAEHYHLNNGFVAETTTDLGGGQNMGFTHVGDYMDYLVEIQENGIYKVNYRIAALNKAGQLELWLLGKDTSFIQLIDIPVTGGWQNWQTVSKNVVMPKGDYTLRLKVRQTEFNLNWFSTELISTPLIEKDKAGYEMKVFPNPGSQQVSIEADFNSPAGAYLSIENILGQSVFMEPIQKAERLSRTIDLGHLNPGLYLVKLSAGTVKLTSKLIIKRQ